MSETAAFFPEPFNVTEIATVLLDGDRFYAAAYVLMGKRERWYACAEQLPRLFLAFMDEEVPDTHLYRLTALMFQWAKRLYPDECQKARKYLAEILDFIDHETVTIMIRKRQFQAGDGVWVWRHPWAYCP